jgi:hypothetical protein
MTIKELKVWIENFVNETEVEFKIITKTKPIEQTGIFCPHPERNCKLCFIVNSNCALGFNIYGDDTSNVHNCW